MSNEIVVGNQILTGTETLFAALTTWHDLVDVYVDGSLDAAIPDSQWNVYAVTSGTRTQIAGGTVTSDPTNGQRVLANVPGKGTTIELWARSVNGASGGAVKAAIVGWSKDSATTNPDDASDATITLTTNSNVTVCNLTWHPLVTGIVQAGSAAKGSLWTIAAIIAGLTSAIPVATAEFLDVVASRIVVQATGGASSWRLLGRSPVGNTGACNVSLFGQSGIEAVLVPTASSVILSGLDTTGIADGDFVYVSAAETVSKTDCSNAAKSKCIGASIGAAGSIVLDGTIVNAKFTTAGGAPVAGASVYLAAAADDGGTGAGKLTATAPVGQSVVIVGVCYDAANYAAFKTSKVALQIVDGAFVPTGTGIPHIVGSIQNATASLIVNADVDPAAAIAASKVVQATGTGIPHVVGSALVAASSLIVNADVDPAAAIASSKIAYADAVPLLVSSPAGGVGKATSQEAVDSLKRNTLVFLRAQTPVGAGVNPYVIATAGSIVLPDTSKAAILLADTFECPWIRAAGAAAVGQMTTTSTTNAAPTTRKGSIAPNGDIIVLGSDLITSMDFAFLPIRQDVVESVFVVTPGTGVVVGLPTGLISILEAEALAGGVVGKKVIQLPLAVAPATGICVLDLAKLNIFFSIADAVTSCRLKVGVIPVESY